MKAGAVRLSTRDVAKLSADLRAQIEAPLNVRPKYGNRRAFWQGQKFDSQHELDVYLDFERQKLAGLIRAVIRQVSFPFSGSARRIRIDFMIVNNDGSSRLVDAKGFSTEKWELKRDLFRDQYGLTIETI